MDFSYSDFENYIKELEFSLELEKQRFQPNPELVEWYQKQINKFKKKLEVITEEENGV